MQPALSPEHQEALIRNKKLQQEYVQLDEEKNFLLHHQGPILENIYLQSVGKYKLELMELKAETFRLKLRMEMIQACLNRGEQINLNVIDTLVQIEIKNELKKIQQEAQKLAEALNAVLQPVLNENEMNEFKKLYYGLAKKLHPDLNPHQEPEMKSVWNRVMEAYRNGDIEKLRLLDDILFPDIGGEESSGLLADLNERNERLASAIISYIKQIENIQSSFPFQLKEFLLDKQWVIEQNNYSLNEISRMRDQKCAFELIIEQLLLSENESGVN